MYMYCIIELLTKILHLFAVCLYLFTLGHLQHYRIVMFVTLHWNNLCCPSFHWNNLCCPSSPCHYFIFSSFRMFEKLSKFFERHGAITISIHSCDCRFKLRVRQHHLKHCVKRLSNLDAIQKSAVVVIEHLEDDVEKSVHEKRKKKSCQKISFQRKTALDTNKNKTKTKTKNLQRLFKLFISNHFVLVLVTIIKHLFKPLVIHGAAELSQRLTRFDSI